MKTLAAEDQVEKKTETEIIQKNYELNESHRICKTNDGNIQCMVLILYQEFLNLHSSHIHIDIYINGRL